MSTKPKLLFGALHPDIKQQLEDQGMSIEALALEVFQKSADAVSWLYVHGLIHKSIADKAYSRLYNRIIERCV